MKHTRLSIAIASAAALALAPFAAAVPTLYFDYGDDGTIDATSIDEVLGSDTALGVAGVVSAFYSNGNFSGIANGATKPNLGTATRPELAETTLNLSGTGKIAIYFSETGYGPTNQGYKAELSITSLATNASVNYYTYATTAAFAPFVGAGTPMTSQQLVALGASSANGSLSFDGSDPLNVPFTLTQKVIINQPNGGSTQLTANLQVPDGGTTLALLGGSLLGLGAIRRKLVKG